MRILGTGVNDRARRGELTGWCAAVVVVAQILLAPGVLLAALALLLTGWLTRWRQFWLVVPALTGGWLLARPGAAVGQLGLGTAAAELAVARHPAVLTEPGALRAAAVWLRPELPVALLAGTAEALVALLVILPGQRGWRPGLLSWWRRRRVMADLAAGRTVTAHGCLIGLNVVTGRPLTISWTDAERGMLISGDAAAARAALLAVACAGMRLRKTVLVADAGDGKLAAQVATMAGQLGRPTAEFVASGAEQIGHGIRENAVVAPELAGGGGDQIGRGIRDKAVIVASGGAAGQLVRAASGVLKALHEVGLRADCLLCVSGCDRLDAAELADLVDLGPDTGTAVVLTRARPEQGPEQGPPGRLTVAPAAGLFAADPATASAATASAATASPATASPATADLAVAGPWAAGPRAAR
jgi:hypothetical protein